MTIEEFLTKTRSGLHGWRFAGATVIALDLALAAQLLGVTAADVAAIEEAADGEDGANPLRARMLAGLGGVG
jgi:hypothetical protein